MRKIRALTRERIRAAIVEQDIPNRDSVYYVRLANKYASSPGFRHIALVGEEIYRPRTNAEVNKAKRAEKAESDKHAGRKGQKQSRLSIRAAHRRKVKAAKLAAKKALENK